MKIQVTFKSGAQIEFEVDEFSTGRDSLTRDLTAVNWKTPANWTRRLHTIEVEEIIAIVAIREPEDAVASAGREEEATGIKDPQVTP